MIGGATMIVSGIRSKLFVALACALACSGTGPTEPAKKSPEQAPGKTPEGPIQGPIDGLPAAEAVLDETIAALGGADKFAALKGYYVESNLDMGTLGLKGTAKGWWSRAGFYNETEMPGIGQMKIGATATKVWREDPVNGLRVLGGKEEEQARWSATLCLVPEWREFFKSARTTAVEDGVAKIELTSPLDDTVVLRIDLKTKLPVSQTFTQASPLGDTPTIVTFADFRDVNGLKVSFKQEVNASLMKAVSVTTKVELDPSMEGVQFDMPNAANAVTPGAPIPEAELKKASLDSKVAGKKEPAKPAKDK